MANHSSHYSMNSTTPRPNTMQSSQQVSTTTLLNALHTSYLNGQPYPLESSTSLVVNTWANAVHIGPDGRVGGTVDLELGRKAWEHARRRAEDGCIILGSLHRSTPPLLAPFASALPLSVPASFYTAINTLRPFLSCVTPYNPTTSRHSALSATFVLSLAGELSRASLSLSTSGIDVKSGLLNIPAETGYRAFDVFYYILKTPSRQEREYLQLKEPSQYTLLRRSGTYSSPSYLPTADDAAAAEDFKNNLRTLGIKGSNYRNLVSALAALLRLGDGVGFLVSDEEQEQICDEVSGLLDLDPEVLIKKLGTDEREALITGIYEALVDWVIGKANEAIRSEMHNGAAIGSSSGSDSDDAGAGAATPPSSQDDEGDKVSITVVEVSSQALGKAVSLKTVFDDSDGINKEMKEDGVPIVPAGSSVIREMKDAVAQSEPDLNIMTGPLGRERDHELDRRQAVLEKVGTESESDSFLRQLLYPVSGEGIVLGKSGRFDLTHVLSSSRVWFQLSLHPNDEDPAKFANQPSLNHNWSAGAVSGQIRGWRLPEWANYRNKQLDFTADFDEYEFTERYGRIGCQNGRDGIQNWLLERGWSNGEIVLGEERVWLREGAWWEAECLLDLTSREEPSPSEIMGGMVGAGGMEQGYTVQTPSGLDSLYAPNYGENPFGDAHRQPSVMHAPSRMGAKSLAPTVAQTVRSTSGGDYGLGHKGDDKYGVNYEVGDSELIDGKVVVEQQVSLGRRIWVAAAWGATFWAPSFLLKHLGRMKRPDVRMAWREKVLLVLIIFLLNAIVVFYIVAFGKLICPKWDKAWNEKEVGFHQGDNDYWVSFRGGVYDLTDFWQLQHSDTQTDTTTELMEPFAGTDVSEYIVPPLYRACAAYVTSDRITLQNNETLQYQTAVHTSGNMTADPTSALAEEDWYDQKFLPRMEEYYKGELVVTTNKVKKEGNENQRKWVIIDEMIYDFTDYYYTKDFYNDLDDYAFLPDEVEELIETNPGGDITKEFNENLNYSTRVNSMTCFDNRFKVGRTDFRESARCQVNNYILLAFTIIICLVIGTKFIAALQLGGRRRPVQQDKFVICQVPAYTEGEDSMRKGLDSLTALQYDNKRKLICVICDGMVVGGGNDRPTPKIVLDILGVDPKIDPPALPFRSVGTGSEQLNYGKVYSGLYEFEGNVVPYLVVVKVGKESEQAKSKPGNRGKRDSQILLMNFLNRVHHRAPMSPLELEMFHQINNIIGVDPELYEYLFMVDADTKVKEDSLNRLVAACANDSKIIGICGETSLENEERSWWTMIQVYEYYISHHLSKAFESLFGSVTCLPGCFCMYRLRTADKGRPLIISDQVIKDYADINTDTLHKKNLLSLGEDRWLTTLMTKYFPHCSFKFIPDAYALTEAPADWSVLLSQRRRWINSTIHNLFELMLLKDLCGFCCFSMRFVVFVDLFGTIILPATCAYLTYLIVIVATGQGQFPLISLIMICSVYGLQAMIFIIKRQWQHIGWMLIYLMAYPIYSFILPIYSFWKQDDFSWGNTRLVLNENGKKAIVAVDEEGFDPRSIPLQRWDDYAGSNNLPGRRGLPMEKEPNAYVYPDDRGYEMDEVQSVYSSAKPASTILTGFPNQPQTYRPPQSPGPFNAYNRQSTYSHLSRYTDNPLQQQQYQQQYQQQQQMPGGMDPQSRLMSMASLPQNYAPHDPSVYSPHNPSQDNLLYNPVSSPPLPQHSRTRSQGYTSRPQSTNNLAGFQTQGPTNEAITSAIRECLAEVDLDSVTKKQLKALAEQKLQCQLSGERKGYLDGQIDWELANMA